MGKEIKRFFVFCSLVSMLVVNLFAESLNAQSSKRNGQEATMNNQTGFTLSVPSEYTRQASQRGKEGYGTTNPNQNDVDAWLKKIGER